MKPILSFRIRNGFEACRHFWGFILLGQLFLAVSGTAAAEQPPGVKVALIDSGISPIAIDAAHIGKGWNYALPRRDTADVIGHGTALAGLILESAPDAVLVPLVYDTRTAGGKPVQSDLNTIVRMIRDAVDEYDCQVINLSAGVTRDVPALREAIAYAEQQGVVVVASVGNRQRTAPELTYYPAAYETVIGVGALRQDGRAASFSQRNGVTLAAPGEKLQVLGLRGESTTASGTSYAAAQVTGAVAAVLAAQPGLQPEQVRQLLYDSARDVEAAGFDPDTGYGAVQMDEALKLLRTGGYGSLKTGRAGLEGPL